MVLPLEQFSLNVRSVGDREGGSAMSSMIRGLWFAGAATFALGAAATGPASADGVNPKDFVFIEAPGQYTVINHSADWWVYGFNVTNPSAGNPDEPSTDQPHWHDSTCTGSGCFGGESGFGYVSDDADNLSTDIAPGNSSDQFFYGPPCLAVGVADQCSKQEFLLINVDRVRTIISPTVPEPSTWVMLAAGFGLVGWWARRRGFAGRLSRA
jgi:hypothetical protein